MEIHERIRYLRKHELHLSQSEFGEKLGVTRGVINNIERDLLLYPERKQPFFQLIIATFHVNEDWLYNGNEPIFSNFDSANMEIHERIRYLRKHELHLSQTEFGAKLGVSRDVINNIERNVLLRPERKQPLFKLIISMFRVNEDWLYNGNEPIFSNSVSTDMKNIDEDALCKRMKQVRESLGLSQNTLAESLGVSRSVIRNIEMNSLSRPQMKYPLLQVMAVKFNINEDWLFYGNEPIFNETENIDFSFLANCDFNEMELILLRSYFKLPKSVRRYMMDSLKEELILYGNARKD